MASPQQLIGNIAGVASQLSQFPQTSSRFFALSFFRTVVDLALYTKSRLSDVITVLRP